MPSGPHIHTHTISIINLSLIPGCHPKNARDKILSTTHPHTGQEDSKSHCTAEHTSRSLSPWFHHHNLLPNLIGVTMLQVTAGCFTKVHSTVDLGGYTDPAPHWNTQTRIMNHCIFFLLKLCSKTLTLVHCAYPPNFCNYNFIKTLVWASLKQDEAEHVLSPFNQGLTLNCVPTECDHQTCSKVQIT